MSKIHVVRSDIPFGNAVNPYVNRFPLVSRLMYARMRAALNMTQAKPASRVLELGCWAGYFLPSLQRRFAEVWGVDDDSASVLDAAPRCWTVLQIARNVCDREAPTLAPPRLVKATGIALPFSPAYFDVVFCLDTFVHIAPQWRARVIAELRRVTRLNGELIFSLPIEIGPLWLLKAGMRAVTGKHYDAAMTTYDFRSDLALLRSLFPVCRTRFIPLQRLGILNPFVVVHCENQKKSPAETAGDLRLGLDSD